MNCFRFFLLFIYSSVGSSGFPVREGIFESDPDRSVRIRFPSKPLLPHNNEIHQRLVRQIQHEKPSVFLRALKRTQAFVCFFREKKENDSILYYSSTCRCKLLQTTWKYTHRIATPTRSLRSSTSLCPLPTSVYI